MGLHHSRLRSHPLINRTDEQKPRRKLALRSSTTTTAQNRMQRAPNHRKRRIQNTRVLAQQIRRGERIQSNRTAISRFILHQGPQEMNSAMVQRPVIRVVADTSLVKRQEHVDGGRRCRVGFVRLLLGRRGAVAEFGGEGVFENS